MGRGSQLSGQKAMRRPRHLAAKATPVILPGTQCSARPKTFFPGHMGLSARPTKRNEPESWPLLLHCRSPLDPGELLKHGVLCATSPSPKGSQALGGSPGLCSFGKFPGVFCSSLISAPWAGCTDGWPWGEITAIAVCANGP